jgi:hypothetical protein
MEHCFGPCITMEHFFVPYRTMEHFLCSILIHDNGTLFCSIHDYGTLFRSIWLNESANNNNNNNNNKAKCRPGGILHILAGKNTGDFEIIDVKIGSKFDDTKSIFLLLCMKMVKRRRRVLKFFQVLSHNLVSNLTITTKTRIKLIYFTNWLHFVDVSNFMYENGKKCHKFKYCHNLVTIRSKLIFQHFSHIWKLIKTIFFMSQNWLTQVFETIFDNYLRQIFPKSLSICKLSNWNVF